MKRLVALFASICFACATIAQTRPNIVLIMADDLGYGDLSCYGSDDIKTPNIDALAKHGIRFTDYHSNGAVCSPTRAALMTGRYQQRCGVEGVITAAQHREVGMPLSEVTIAEVLKDAGYATAIFGKWHLGYDVKRFGPQLQGFDTFEGFVSGNVDYFFKIDQQGYKDWWIGDKLDDEPNYLTTVIGERAVKWIGEHKDEPFFLYLPHGAPHYPYQTPDGEGFRVVGKPGVKGPPRNDKHAYAQMIEALDDSVGQVVAALKEQGLEDNTLVIFCSDNGPAGPGSAGALRGHKGQVYEGGHRVPMIMKWPAMFDHVGVDRDITVLGMDLFPTFASIAKAQLPNDLALDGVDLFSTAESKLRERTAFWVHGDQYAMRDGVMKLVVRGKQPPELYNLAKDPAESSYLAAQRPDEVRRMVEACKAWMKDVRQGVEPVSGEQ